MQETEPKKSKPAKRFVSVGFTRREYESLKKLAQSNFRGMAAELRAAIMQQLN